MEYLSTECPPAVLDPPNSPPCELPPHEVEHSIRRLLLSHPEFRFSSLVVRRISDTSVCLDGVVEYDGELDDVANTVIVDGVDTILNRLVIRQPPAKG